MRGGYYNGPGPRDADRGFDGGYQGPAGPGGNQGFRGDQRDGRGRYNAPNRTNDDFYVRP